MLIEINQTPRESIDAGGLLRVTQSVFFSFVIIINKQINNN